jgi:hypothetical protein
VSVDSVSTSKAKIYHWETIIFSQTLSIAVFRQRPAKGN